MSKKQQPGPAKALDAWEKNLPTECREGTCQHTTTVDHINYDRCGNKMKCVTCAKPVFDSRCYLCHTTGIKTESKLHQLIIELVDLMQDNVSICPYHAAHKETTPRPSI